MTKELKCYTVEDFAEIMQCSLKKAYKIVRQKDFPKIKIGRQYYIPQEKLEEWMNLYVRKEYVLY